MLASKCRGLGAIHLLPLDPSIEKLHHESGLLLGPSHILVQYAQQEKELQMVGLGRKHQNDIEGGGLGFVSLIDLARLNEVFVALHCVLTPYNEEVGGAFYVIPIRGSVVELHSPTTAIRASLQWKDYDFSVCSSVPEINSGLVGQDSEPFFDKSPVHYGALWGPMQLRKVHSYHPCHPSASRDPTCTVVRMPDYRNSSSHFAWPCRASQGLPLTLSRTARGIGAHRPCFFLALPQLLQPPLQKVPQQIFV